LTEHYKENPSGFEWGSLEVIRCMSHPKWGVILEVRTKREVLTIRATPGGFLRVEEVEKRKDKG